MKKRKLVIAVTGASGSIYAQQLLDKLSNFSDQIEEVGVVLSKNASDVWEFELGNRDFEELPYKRYDKSDFFAPFASGSAKYDTMIIVPCSMGTMSRISTGISDDLITRAADVMLKERRKLIMAIRETPYHQIQLENMLRLTQAGAIIAPCTPSFYSKPKSIEEVANTVVDRLLDLAGFDPKTHRWQE
jgi:4-hydroxy-3-polyprenylbenzoate decarboxylase